MLRITKYIFIIAILCGFVGPSFARAAFTQPQVESLVMLLEAFSGSQTASIVDATLRTQVLAQAVSSVAPQVSCTLSVTHPSITKGESINLSWKTTLSHGKVTKVDRTTYPTRTTLSWTGESNHRIFSTGQEVYINGTKQTISINSGVGAIYLPAGIDVAVGDTVHIGAPSFSGISMSINQGIGSVSPAALGSRSVSPQSTTTYTATISGSAGTATCATTVGVSIPKPVIPSIRSGLLKRSDVVLSPRSYKSNWFENFQAFSANRILWTYDGIKLIPEATPKNIPVQCTVPFWVPIGHPQEEQMVCTTASGGYGGKPTDLTGNSSLRRPDINSEAWRAYQLAEVKKLIDAGCTSFQQDDPMLNAYLTEWGGCYQPESKAKYTTYLAGKTPTPGLWQAFQQKSTTNHHQWLHAEARAYAKMRNIPGTIIFSANTWGERGEWLTSYFDFFLTEAYSTPTTRVQKLIDMAEFADSLGKINSITIPYSDVVLNQRSIASAYALGLVTIAPWDITSLQRQLHRFCIYV
jgi:hypothetical protein